MVMVNGRVRYPRKAGCSMELTCEFACCAWLLATWEKRRSLSLENVSLGIRSGLTPDSGLRTPGIYLPNGNAG